jgi:hypothetical protein
LIGRRPPRYDLQQAHPGRSFPVSIQEIYDRSIKPLPAADRLRLAALILNDIPPQAVVDYSEEWSAEDFRDFSRATWHHIEGRLTEPGNG